MVLQTKNSVIILLISFVLLIGCNKNKAISTAGFNPGEMPSMHAEYVNSLISDSGITRYRMEAQVWDMYSDIPEPYWHFPKGVYLEQFDSLFNVIGSIEADTAYYFENKELWRLVGNVFIQNLEGHTFETSELFWNQREPAESENAVYTDKVVRIDQGDNITTSRGLRGNQRLTKLRLIEVVADIWMKDEAMNPAPIDSIDSATPKPSTIPSAGNKKVIQSTTKLEENIER